MADLMVSYDSDGPIAKTSTELNTMLVDEATALAPGLTADLPGSLIEDMASTGTGGLIVMDQMRIDLLNSLGVQSANLTLLKQLAQQYGVPAQKTAGKTTVPVQFTGTAGYSIPKGFIVSDGTNQYAIDTAAVISSTSNIGSGLLASTTGTSAIVTATAVNSGSWPVAAGAVTTCVTSVPDDISLSVTNLTAGTAASTAETNTEFRQRVWAAGMFTVAAYPDAIRTALQSVANIDSRQISVVQNAGNFSVMCGGGDNYQQALAVFQAGGDFTRLVGTTLSVTGITNANPGVVTTDLTHGFSDGQVIKISGVSGMSGINDTSLTITVIDAHSFSIGVDTTSAGTWTSGGVVTPNLRNTVTAINDYPDTYNITTVQPLRQTVEVAFTWATQSLDYLTNALILSLVSANVQTYINSIYAGQPINLNILERNFLTDMSNTVKPELFTTLDVSIVVDGVLTDADAGTNIIRGDKFSYWYIDDASVTIKEAS